MFCPLCGTGSVSVEIDDDTQRIRIRCHRENCESDVVLFTDGPWAAMLHEL